MKVVFIEEVPGTAVPGEVKEVKNGFARNYLLPRKLAVPATAAAMQRAESLSKKEEKRQAGLDSEAQKIVDKLEGKQVLIRARVGEQGRLYGSVTTNDIANHIDEILGEPIDRRRIMLAAPLREVGTRQVALRLTRNVTASVDVVIEADESSSRGRRSSAPAGGTILMAPRRGRAAQQEFEVEDEEIKGAAAEGDTAEDDEMVEATTAPEVEAIEEAEAEPDAVEVAELDEEEHESA